MTPQEIIDYCVKKPGAYIDYPFGDDTLVVKVKSKSQGKGRIFAQLIKLNGEDCATLNCDRATGEFYRQVYPGTVTRGWHCPPVMQPYFNTVRLNGEVDDEELRRMIEHSYTVVVLKMPKYVQKELSGH